MTTIKNNCNKNIIFKVYDKECNFKHMLFSVIGYMLTLSFFNFFVYYFYMQGLKSLSYKNISLCELNLYFFPLPILINIIIIYSIFVLPVQLSVSQDYFELCFTFWKERVYFRDIKSYSIRVSTFGNVRLMWKTERKKRYCFFVFGLGGPDPYFVAKKLREIFEEKTVKIQTFKFRETKNE